MEQVTTSEMLKQLPAILGKIAEGKHLIVTEDDGTAVAELCPPPAQKPEVNFKKALLEFRRKHPLNATIEEIIAWKNEGRQ